MKQIEVTTQVMKNVSQFERKRSKMWLGRFLLILLVFCGVIGFVLLNVYQAVSDREFLLMLPMYTQDVETFQESWKEAVGFVWENLPQLLVILGVVAILGGIIFVIFTHKRRKVVLRRLKETSKYQ